jgi:hypothetical protein
LLARLNPKSTGIESWKFFARRIGIGIKKYRGLKKFNLRRAFAK